MDKTQTTVTTKPHISVRLSVIFLIATAVGTALLAVVAVTAKYFSSHG